MALKAERYEPFTPRRRSCVSSLPSMEMLTLSRPASFAARARSGVMPRPPLVLAFVPSARATMPARQIAAQRDLPDAVDGSGFLVDGARGGGQRQLPAR